jgi:hypothetical protein
VSFSAVARDVAAFLSSRAPRFIRWFALLFVASLFVPAVTKQWSGLRKFVGTSTSSTGEEPWPALSCAPTQTCGDMTHSRAYLWLGNQLLYEQQAFLEDLLEANGSGFSTGWRDFIHDLVPLR